MFRTFGAFAAGVVVGWVGRGVIGTERELLIRTVALAQTIKDRVARAAGEQVEWWEDLVAEARARVDLRHGDHHDEDAKARVIRVA